MKARSEVLPKSALKAERTKRVLSKNIHMLPELGWGQTKECTEHKWRRYNNGRNRMQGILEFGKISNFCCDSSYTW